MATFVAEGLRHITGGLNHAQFVVCQVIGAPSLGARSAFAITAAIGLLHGFGFSFLLREIQRGEAANVWQSLLAFNIGIEIGHLAIVLVAWPAAVLLRAVSTGVWLGARGRIAAGVSAVAAVWAVDRMAGYLARGRSETSAITPLRTAIPRTP